jgi:hypothetical protein
MYVCIYVYIYTLYLSLSLSLYYIYIYILCVCIYIYIYVYIYIYIYIYKHGHDLAVKLDKLVDLRENLNAYVASAKHGPERQSVRFADVQVSLDTRFLLTLLGLF